MTSSMLTFEKITTAFLLLFCSLAATSVTFAAKSEGYNIIYIRTNDLTRVLDYKEELESVFDMEVKKKLKVVGREGEYALIFDSNLSSRKVAKTLIKHAELLDEAGFDEPYAIQERKFDSLFNVSYGIGPNLSPLKEKFQVLYTNLGEEVKRDLFIEQTHSGNYVLIYRFRGDEVSTIKVAKQHAKLLRAEKIATSIARENNNTIVYGESSLIDDKAADNPAICLLPIASINTENQNKPTADQKNNEPVKPQKITATEKAEKKSILAAQTENFQLAIENHIANLRNKGIIDKDETTGWMVYDLDQDQLIVTINADVEFQAASMIKPFVALAYFHLVKEKKLKYGKQAREQMEAMIQRSSNPATNWVIKQVGGPAQCSAILKQYYNSIFKKTRIVEYIPAGGRTYLNSAPPSDYVRFLRALWSQELPSGEEMQRLMALPKRGRLYHGTPIPIGTLVYSKTGSTARLCGDMGILVPRTQNGAVHPYVVVGVIERASKASNYGQWMHSRGRIIRGISTLIYEELKKEHQLI